MGEGQITNFAVHEGKRGQGWGEKLLLYSMSELKKRGRKDHVRGTSFQSIVHNRSIKNWGLRLSVFDRKFYKVCPEDAMIMWVSLNEKTSDTRNRNELR